MASAASFESEMPFLLIFSQTKPTMKDYYEIQP